MRSRLLVCTLILCSAVVLPAQLPSKSGDPTALKNPLSLPMGFERSSGESGLDFIARAAGYSVYLSPGEVVLSFAPAEKEQGAEELVRISFEGANKQALAEAEEALPGVIH